MNPLRQYGKAWEKISPSRYRRAVEIYQALPGGGSNRVYQHLKGLRSGPTNAAPVAMRAMAHEQRGDAQGEVPPTPTPDKGGALAAIAKGIGKAIEWEQQLTKVFGKIPFWKMPALTVGDFSIGLPHGHMHPPNLIPPSTVPIPIPGAGPVLKIPYLSGADRTKHAGKPAAMCGDMGAAAWCGGYVPMFEIYLGSAHVWIEGNRAARVLCDVVKHCTFTTPKPSDPPLGPMVGVSAGGVGHIGIGGVPMPSLFSFAVGKALQALASAGGKVFRKVTAKSFVDDLIRRGVIQFNPKLTDMEILKLEKEFVMLASTRTGRTNLKRVAKANKKHGFTLTMSPSPTPGNSFGWTKGGWHPAGYRDLATGKPGAGFDAEISHSPFDWPNASSPKTPSDAVLNHELNHAANVMEGKLTNHACCAQYNWGKHNNAAGQQQSGRWQDFEEFETTHVDNAYRRERGGMKQRKNYAHMT